MYKVTSRWPHQNSIKIEWNLGKRCNYDCSYCPSSIHDHHSPHTSIEVLKNTVDQLCKLDRPVRISLTGGEPAVHPRIEELLKYMRERDVGWVNLTTNGTRPAQWYLDQSSYINHIVFSLHFEHDWQRVYNTIKEYSNLTNKNFFVNVMAHHDYMEQVKQVVAKFHYREINYAVRRIRWTEGDHNVFDDLRYAGEDLKWLLEQDSTADTNVVIDEINLIHSNDVIKKHLNQFKGWSCNAGIESLMINWDGEVHRATCRVGGSLGNIYQGTFELPTEPIICIRDWCTCAADIPITKVKL